MLNVAAIMAVAWCLVPGAFAPHVLAPSIYRYFGDVFFLSFFYYSQLMLHRTVWYAAAIHRTSGRSP